MPYRIGLLLFLLSCACVLPSSAQSLKTDITVSGTPSGVAVNPSNNRIYVNLLTSTGPAVGVINGATNTQIATIATPYSGFIAVNIVTGRVYVPGCTYTQPETCDVVVIDGTTNAIIKTISFPTTPKFGELGIQGIAVDPVRNRVYLTDDNDFQIVVINGNTNTVMARVPTSDQEVLGLAVDFSTNQIVTAASGDEIDVLSGSTGKLTYITVGTLNQNVAIDSLTARAYVTNQGISPTLAVVNLSSQKAVASVALGSTPFGVCVDYLSNIIFTTLTNQTVAVINGKTNTVIGTVAADGYFIDVNPVTRLAYASDASGAYVVHVISE